MLAVAVVIPLTRNVALNEIINAVGAGVVAVGAGVVAVGVGVVGVEVGSLVGAGVGLLGAGDGFRVGDRLGGRVAVQERDDANPTEKYPGAQKHVLPPRDVE